MFSHLVPGMVDGDQGDHLYQEDCGEEYGEDPGETRALHDGATAAKEGDGEDCCTEYCEEDGGAEEGVREEVQVVAVGCLDHQAGQQEEQTGDLGRTVLVCVGSVSGSQCCLQPLHIMLLTLLLFPYFCEIIFFGKCIYCLSSALDICVCCCEIFCRSDCFFYISLFPKITIVVKTNY